MGSESEEYVDLDERFPMMYKVCLLMKSWPFCGLRNPNLFSSEQRNPQKSKRTERFSEKYLNLKTFIGSDS